MDDPFRPIWDTPKANADDMLRLGTRARGSKCNAKLAESDVLEIRRLRDEGISMCELARGFGVTSKNIEALVARRSWEHLPCPRVAVAPQPTRG